MSTDTAAYAASVCVWTLCLLCKNLIVAVLELRAGPQYMRSSAGGGGGEREEEKRLEVTSWQDNQRQATDSVLSAQLVWRVKRLQAATTHGHQQGAI